MKKDKQLLPVTLSLDLKKKIKTIVDAPLTDYKSMTSFVLQAIEEKLEREESVWLKINKQYKTLQSRKNKKE